MLFDKVQHHITLLIFMTKEFQNITKLNLIIKNRFQEQIIGFVPDI